MNNKNFTEELLRLLPYWHYRIDKPFKAFMKDKMSLETYYCLQVLLRKGPMTMTELTRHLNVSKQQATKLIEILCSHDFVRRLPTEHDRRCIVIEVTECAKDYMINTIYKDTSFAAGCADTVRRALQAGLTCSAVLPGCRKPPAPDPHYRPFTYSMNASRGRGLL